MSQHKTSSLYIICLLAGLFATQAQALGFSMGNKPFERETGTTTNRPWGNITATKPAPQYQPPQSPQSGYYLGGAPDTGWAMPQRSSYSMATSGQPIVEVDISSSVVYEQQSLIYTARVVSQGNLKSLNPEVPSIDGAVLELIDGPVASVRKDGPSKQSVIVNTFRYKLRPLRSGQIVIPPIRFYGTHASSRQAQRMPGSTPGGNFNITASRDLTLRARPAEASVSPWLPLHDLKLNANLLQSGPVKAGEPVILELELAAKGALGNQLPSLAQQLESPQYRIYRDATTVKNGISARGNYLTGSRKEIYTIIPLEDGWVRLPEVTLAWWDVDSHSARVAGLPFAHAVASGDKGQGGAQTSGKYTLTDVLFWAPLVIVLSLIAGYWLGAWPRTRALMDALVTRTSALRQQLATQIHKVGAGLSVSRQMTRVRMGLALLMPRSVKLWMCSRCHTSEVDPEAWCAEFKARICQHLDIAANAPLTHVAEKLIVASPQAEPAKLRALTRSLDRAIYGSTPLDFPRWRRDFSGQLRPRPLNWRRALSRRSGARLPELNPHSA